MSTPAGDDLLGQANIRIDADTDPAIRALGRLSRDAQGRLRDIRGRFVDEATLIRIGLVDAAGGSDEFGRSLRGAADSAGRLGSVLGPAVGALGSLGGALAGVGAAAGSAVPLLAGVVTTLQNIAPAGAVAVSGMLAVQQASAVIKLGMVGVEDAVTAAFDTSKEGAENFAAALEKLSPSAQAFARQVRELAPAFRTFQQSVQEELFIELDSVLKTVAQKTLPVLQSNLTTTANTLGNMAASTGLAAAQLAENGTLGKAMDGANKGLQNLSKIPSQVVTGLGQLAVAGAPALDRLTTAVAGKAADISQRLAGAFKSGALTDAVNTAIDLVVDLGSVFGNVFGIIENVIAPVQEAGGGFVNVLLEITGALREATAAQGFQDAISAVAGVMATFARTVGPLLKQALAALGPVFTALGPPIDRLIRNLGAALGPVIQALGPVLGAAASAFGSFVDAGSEILPVVGNLIASLLPPLVPLLQAVGDVFRQAAPVVFQLANALSTALEPILAQLPGLIAPFADIMVKQAEVVFPLLSDVIEELAPSLAQIGASFAELLVEAAPLIKAVGEFAVGLITTLLPALTPVISFVGQLAAILADQLGSVISNVIIPAVQFLSALLTGDFSAAWQSLKDLVAGIGQSISDTVSGIVAAVNGLVAAVIAVFQRLFDVLVGNSIVPDLVNAIVDWFTRLPKMAFDAVVGIVVGLSTIASNALTQFRNNVITGATAAVNWLRGLPDRALSALGALRGTLVRIAVSSFLSFAGSVRTGVNTVIDIIRGLPSRVVTSLGRIGNLLLSAGNNLIQGMINGVRNAAGSLVSAARDAVAGAVDAAKDFLGISSPSKVFAEIGADTGEGFVQGFTAMEDRITNAVRDVAATVPESFTTPVMPSPRLSAVRAALDAGGFRQAQVPGGVVVNLTLNLTNTGVLGSQFETEDWLIRALDTAARTGRLPRSLTTASGV